MADAAETLRGHRLAVDVEGRRIRLVEPARGDPGGAVLRALGLVEGVAPVGAAAHGPTGVAAGVWCDPELYLVRWTRGRRWVVGYRLGDSRPNHYVRTEGRIPTRFETGNWYGAVPAEVDEAFLSGDLLLDEPPFPLPVEPSPPPVVKAVRPARAAPARKARATGPTAPGGPRARPVTTRLCPSCRMHKAPGQFVEGSELCVDCR